MLYRMYRQTRSKNTNENKMQKLQQYKKKQKTKAALDIASAVTAKLWYKVIKDVQRIKPYKCTLSHAVLAEKYSTVNRRTWGSITMTLQVFISISQKRGLKLIWDKSQKTSTNICFHRSEQWVKIQRNSRVRLVLVLDLINEDMFIPLRPNSEENVWSGNQRQV